MAKLTIAQRRELQVEKFNNEYIHDIEKARRILNKYYRYVAIHQRVFMLENDSRLYNTTYAKEEAAKAERREASLLKDLQPYGIKIYIPWTLPFLGIIDENTGAVSASVIDPILY